MLYANHNFFFFPCKQRLRKDKIRKSHNLIQLIPTGYFAINFNAEKRKPGRNASFYLAFSNETVFFATTNEGNKADVEKQMLLCCQNMVLLCEESKAIWKFSPTCSTKPEEKIMGKHTWFWVKNDLLTTKIDWFKVDSENEFYTLKQFQMNFILLHQNALFWNAKPMAQVRFSFDLKMKNAILYRLFEFFCHWSTLIPIWIILQWNL